MGYKQVDAADLAALIEICGASRVRAARDLSADYAHDAMIGLRQMPEVMVEPVSTHEVSAILRYAYERAIPVTARGQGTGLAGGAVPLQGGILLNLCRMNRVLDLDEENLTLTVEPGVLLIDIYTLVEQHDLFYPVNPGQKCATIGGNVATNAGGMSAVKYGVTRDYVRGLEVVLADGDVIQTGGKIGKNSSGYSLKDLLVGSEGTLGIVTKIVLRLLPLPRHTATLLAAFVGLPEAVRAVPEIIKAKVNPRALEFVEPDFVHAAETYLGMGQNSPFFFPNVADATGIGAYLLLMLDGCSIEAIEQERDRAVRAIQESGALGVDICDAQRSTEIWRSRGAFVDAIQASTTQMEQCDLVVPRTELAEFVVYARKLQEKFGVRIKTFGHAGDGNLHIYVLRDQLDQDDWSRRLSLVFDCLYRRAEELGGQVSGEHGIGYAKRKFLEETAGVAVMDVMRKIKAAMDPKGILNPGKIVYYP